MSIKFGRAFWFEAGRRGLTLRLPFIGELWATVRGRQCVFSSWRELRRHGEA